MAKVAFSKLGLKLNTPVASFEQNGQIIEVKQYLPIQEKLEIITNVLDNCQDDTNFINEAKLTMFLDLEIIYKYTNITFTDKQKEDLYKLYDLLVSNDIVEDVLNCIPKIEYATLFNWVHSIANHIYDYRNSIYGILDAMNTDYQNLNLDISNLSGQLSDPNNLKLLKDILTKMG